MLSRRLIVLGLAAAPITGRGAPRYESSALVAAARRQIGVTNGYDNGYHRIGYPGGDVPRATGVCADVVIRAVRDAWGLDLQQLLHDDMSRHFAAYPRRWGLPGPDSNIDHRRVPNLETYWDRHGAKVGQAKPGTLGWIFPGALQPGDFLTWRGIPFGGPHVAIVSQGGPWTRIIQNRGWGVHEEPLAVQWLNTAEGHFRWRPVI